MGKVANVLFPADYFDKRRPDETLRTEHDAAAADARLDVRVFDLERFEERGDVLLARPFLDPELPLVYRGWMMKPTQYAAFFRELRAAGLSPITSPAAYDEFHMFPLAYERHAVLREHAPRLVAFAGRHADAGVVNAAFGASGSFMVKDYVKSVKGTSFPSRLETPIYQGHLDELVTEFVRLRGELFTEGIVCKEFFELARRGGATNEWRTFYLGGSVLSLCRNSSQPESSPSPPVELVEKCAGLGSPYYTVDFAERADGSWIVVETGDGQVSGLAAAQGQGAYYQALADAFLFNETRFALLKNPEKL